MKFRFWLNAKFVKAQVGMNTKMTEIPIEKIDV